MSPFRLTALLSTGLLTAGLFCALFARPASALDGNDELVLALDGGAVVTGWYVGVDGGILRLSGNNRFLDVPVDQVVAVQRDGVLLSLVSFQSEIDQEQARLDALRADPPALPAPAVAAASSMLWAGAGHAATGDWKAAAGWAAVDAVLVGAAAYTFFGERSVGATIPVVAIDVLVRAAAAGDSARLARRNRRKLQGLVPATSVGQEGTQLEP